jgi:hypothetical protein
MSNHSTNALMQATGRMLAQMQPLKTKKSPITAAICGLAFGAIGLGLYFGSIAECVIPAVIWVLAIFLAPASGGTLLIAAPFFCALYGYVRVTASNQKLEEAQPSVSSPPRPKPINKSTVFEADVVMPSPRYDSKPPAVPAQVQPHPTEDRLQRLTDLLRKGMISQNEHDQKRHQILADI